MTVKVFCDNNYDAAKIADTLGGKLDLETASVDLKIECPHKAESQIREEIKSTTYSVAVVEDS